MWTEVIPIYSTCSILSTIYKWKHMGMPSAGSMVSNKPQMLVYTVIYQRIKDHCRHKHCFWAGMWVMMWSTQDSLILVGTRLDENICMHEELNEYESMIRGFFSRNFKFHHHHTLFFFPFLCCWSLYWTLLGKESDFCGSTPIIFTTVNFSWCLLE